MKRKEHWADEFFVKCREVAASDRRHNYIASLEPCPCGCDGEIVALMRFTWASQRAAAQKNCAAAQQRSGGALH